MEDNKNIRTLTDEELKQVSGRDGKKKPFPDDNLQDCQETCRRRGAGLFAVIKDGVCICEKKQ